MVAKEIQLGIAAYNLVRAMIALASQQSGIPPRGYSFTKVRRILEAFGPALADAPNQHAAKRIFDQMMKLISQSKLPRRRRKRPSYPGRFEREPPSRVGADDAMLAQKLCGIGFSSCGGFG